MYFSDEKQGGALEKAQKDGRTAQKMQINQPRFYEKKKKIKKGREAAYNPEQIPLPQRWK